MSARMVLQRLCLLVACFTLIASCASTPAPSKSKKKKKRSSDDTELKESKRKKKKKKKKVVVAEKEPEDEDEDKDKDEDDDEDAPPTKPKTKREIKAERDRERKTRLESERENRKDIDDENKREAKRTASRDDDDEEDTEDDEDDESGDSKRREAEKKAKAKKEAEAKAKADREAKAEAAREAKAEAARKAKEEREAKAEAARKLKEEREAKAKAAREAKAEAARQAKAKQAKKRDADEDEDDDADEDDEDDDDEETPKTAATSKTKPAEKDKAKTKSKPSDDDEEDDEDDDDEESPPKTASKVAAKTKPADKAKAKPPADEGVIDMTGAEPEAPPEPEADDEDREPGKEFDESSDDPLAEKRVAAIPVPGVDGEPSETDTGPAVAVAALTGIHGRPLTLGKDRIEAHGGLRVSTVTVRDPVAGTTTSTTSEGLTLGATYGLSDKAQAGFDYTLGLSPGAIKGPFNLLGALSAKRSSNLEIAFAAALAFDFVDIVNSTTMMTSSQTNAGLQLGFWMRYRATPKVSVFTGSPALPTTSPGLSKQALPLPPFAYQVAIGLNNAGTTAIEIPLGIGVAPIPNLYAFASVNFAHVRIANTQSAYLFGDFVPIVLGGFYSLTKADIGIVFSDDLKQGTDYLRFDAMLRYSIR